MRPWWTRLPPSPCNLAEAQAVARPGEALPKEPLRDFDRFVRTFNAAGRCGIPATAKALSLNITVVAPSQGGYVTLSPGSYPVPLASTINFSGAQTRGNNAVLRLGGAAERPFKAMAVLTGSGTVHLVVDVNGYFE